MSDQNTQGINPPAAGAPPPTPPAADAGNVQNPEAQAASREAASYRTKLRDAEAKLTAATEENERLKSETTAATGGSTKAEIATLKREVSDVRTKLELAEKTAKEERERRIEKQIEADLSRIGANVLEGERKYAVRLMRASASVDDDGVSVFEVENDKGEKVKVPATEENARKYLLPTSFYPARGVGGTGSGSPMPVDSSAIDWARASTDQKYFEENYDRIKAARRASATR